MVLVSLISAVALYLFCSFAGLADPVAAQPFSRFSHRVQTLPIRAIHEDPYLSLKRSRQAQNAESRARLRRRGLPGAVYICIQDNFRGDCAWTAPTDECHIVGTGDNSPKSIGPDENGFCALYEKADCTGDVVQTLRFPGQASNLPAFAGLKCFADGSSIANTTRIIQNADGADPRLAGGVGSMERMKLKDVMDAMERDGFSRGMIGLKKGHYY